MSREPSTVGLGEALDAATQQTEALGDAVLGAFLEQQLQTEAQPEVGPPVLHRSLARILEPGVAQPLGRVAKRADAGQHDTVRARDILRIRRHVDDETRAFERLRNTAKIARAVVHECGPYRGAHRAVSLWKA